MAVSPGPSNSNKEAAMASDVRSLWIPANTGNPVDVFFPNKDMAIAVYERGYTSISLAKGGRISNWLASDMLWDELKLGPVAMMRVRFWNSDARDWKEKLFVEAYGGVGDVQDEFIVGLTGVQVGPVEVISTRTLIRMLTLLRGGPDWAPQRVIEWAKHAVAFCQDDLSLDLAIVSDIHFANKRLWLRAAGGKVERHKLPAEGEVEPGHGIAAILKPSGEVYLAKISANTARFVAGDAWIVGLSPDGTELAMCRRESGSWVWDFRQVSNPEKPIRVLLATAPVELGLTTTPCIARVSPDFRWAVAISQGYVVAWPVQEGV
jgi:hypothetical protein